jgi:large conductance mechanosensitive channel
MKNFWKDFKAFISKGNIIDLAIAVIIGGAFGKIVTSLVNDVIMPLISLATGGVSVSDWKWVITPADPIRGIAESSLNYGFFIQTIIDFLIISFFIFLAIRLFQKSKSKLEEIAKEIKTETIKKRRKNKKGEVEEITETTQIVENKTADIVKEETPVVSAKVDETPKDEVLESITKVVEETQKSNKSQEALLREIRDLLKNK